jgi:hypothetical protein
MPKVEKVAIRPVSDVASKLIVDYVLAPPDRSRRHWPTGLILYIPHFPPCDKSPFGKPKGDTGEREIVSGRQVGYNAGMNTLPWLAAASAAICALASASPVALHPANPHYFLFRDKPVVFLTSGEHYGAVLNRAFDFRKYLAELEANGLNGTRTFTGAYVEPAGAFNITRNTLAPGSGDFIAPWARSGTPGYPNGGNKFDLTRWDEAYFARLKEFLSEADRRGIIVELALFCPFYEEMQWKLSPFNQENNVNGIGGIARTNAYTLDRSGGLLGVQEALTRKLVTELNGYDNLIFEICNEPYFGGVTLDWQHHIAELIAQTEKALPKQHLISRNVQNGATTVDRPHPAISIYNFHYASPPDAVAMNYALGKVIGDNETGFRGTNDLAYRVEAWAFLVAGGGLFNHLDYSFATGFEDGTFVYPSTQPGGGNRAYRLQLRALRDFIYSFDFVKMAPDASVFVGGVPAHARAYCLRQEGEAYAIYLGPKPGQKGEAAPHHGEVELKLKLPSGAYEVRWLNPVSGKYEKAETIQSRDGQATLRSPRFEQDIAVSIRRR